MNQTEEAMIDAGHIRDAQLKAIEDNLKVIANELDNRLNQMNLRMEVLQRQLSILREKEGCRQ